VSGTSILASGRSSKDRARQGMDRPAVAAYGRSTSPFSRSSEVTMLVIAGATGRVGSAAASALLAAGADTRVLVRDPVRGAGWAARGADVVVADLTDRAALAAALTDADGLFALLPFDLTAPDLDAHARTLTAAVAGAVRDSGLRHVVALSSGGADLPAGTGPIVGLHHLEEALRATAAVVTAVRPGHFQEKVADVVHLARDAGVYPVLAGSADTPHPLVATRDVGAVVARALLDPPGRDQVLDVLGPVATEREVAAVLAAALRRELEVVTVPEPAWADALVDAGLPRHAAEAVAELYRADDRGLLAPRGDRVEHGTTPLADTVARLVGTPAGV
jgi:uncharacterized protein YbjT (DUF2867 family)